MDFLLTENQLALQEAARKFAQREGSKYQLTLKTASNQSAKPFLSTDSYHFALSENGLLYHIEENLNADIYQTLSE